VHQLYVNDVLINPSSAAEAGAGPAIEEATKSE
jgi:hypothetical protein